MDESIKQCSSGNGSVKNFYENSQSSEELNVGENAAKNKRELPLKQSPKGKKEAGERKRQGNIIKIIGIGGD